MKLLNEHWNGFRSSQSLVDAYKTLYHSLGLQIKIVASWLHIVPLGSAGAWPLEEPEAHLNTLLLTLSPGKLVCIRLCSPVWGSCWPPGLSLSCLFPPSPLWVLRDSALAGSAWTVGMHHQHQNLVQETAGLNWHPCLRKVFPALISVLNQKIPVFKLSLCGRIAC